MNGNGEIDTQSWWESTVMVHYATVAELWCVWVIDDMNWNALEWDRAAEELTWERVRATHMSAWPDISYSSSLLDGAHI